MKLRCHDIHRNTCPCSLLVTDLLHCLENNGLSWVVDRRCTVSPLGGMLHLCSFPLMRAGISIPKLLNQCFHVRDTLFPIPRSLIPRNRAEELAGDEVEVISILPFVLWLGRRIVLEVFQNVLLIKHKAAAAPVVKIRLAVSPEGAGVKDSRLPGSAKASCVTVPEIAIKSATPTYTSLLLTHGSNSV